MKNKLCTVVLVLSIFSSNANAVVATEATQLANVFQTTLTAVKSAATAASAAVIEAKTTVSAAIDQWVKETAWVQQAKDMWQTIQDINKAREELTREITGVTAHATNFENWVTANTAANPATKVDYGYAQLLPNELVTEATCEEGSECVVTGVGFTSPSAELSSLALRDSLKVNPNEVGSVLGVGKNIRQISREAAELNAQEQAVIDTMAREAFIQASNRIKAIQHLEDGLLKPPAGEANDLKYTTDIQAMIVAQQALLINDQNKISALAVLQQSQKDRYEQRKKEIANYVVYGSKDNGIDPITGLPISVQALERVAIAEATKKAYDKLEGWYK